MVPSSWPICSCPALLSEQQVELLECPVFLAIAQFPHHSLVCAAFQLSSITAHALLVLFPDVLCTSLTHSVGFLSPIFQASFLHLLFSASPLLHGCALTSLCSTLPAAGSRVAFPRQTQAHAEPSNPLQTKPSPLIISDNPVCASPHHKYQQVGNTAPAWR